MLDKMLMVGPSGSNTWVATFNGAIRSEVVDAAGNSYIAAYAYGPSKPSIIKISPEGVVLWAYEISADFDYNQSQICLNANQTELYLAAPQQSYIGNAFCVFRFNVAGTLLSQKKFQDGSNYGQPYVWGVTANDSFIYVSMQGYYSASGYTSAIFKIAISTLTISAKWGYNTTGRFKNLQLNSAGTALYAITNTSTYGLVFVKIDTSNLGINHSTYINFSESMSSNTIYGLAVDSAETNAYIVGVGYFTLSGFTQNWPLLFSVKADGTGVNWNRVARASASTSGYLDVQLDNSNNVYVNGALYNGTLWKKQFLKVSSANSILFSNAFDAPSQSNEDGNVLRINNANSTIKFGYTGGPSGGQAFHSLPIGGSALGAYVVDTYTYTYSSFTPTYYTVSPSMGSAGVNILNAFNNYAAATSAYTFPAISVTLAKKDIP